MPSVNLSTIGNATPLSAVSAHNPNAPRALQIPKLTFQDGWISAKQQTFKLDVDFEENGTFSEEIIFLTDQGQFIGRHCFYREGWLVKLPDGMWREYFGKVTHWRYIDPAPAV